MTGVAPALGDARPHLKKQQRGRAGMNVRTASSVGEPGQSADDAGDASEVAARAVDIFQADFALGVVNKAVVERSSLIVLRDETLRHCEQSRKCLAEKMSVDC